MYLSGGVEGRQDRGRGGDREEWRGDRIEGEEWTDRSGRRGSWMRGSYKKSELIPKLLGL